LAKEIKEIPMSDTQLTGRGTRRVSAKSKQADRKSLICFAVLALLLAAHFSGWIHLPEEAVITLVRGLMFLVEKREGRFRLK
jgi:hypothetical protein